MALFEDSRKRIARAIKHGKAFSDEWNGLFDPNAFEVRTEHKGNGTLVLVGRFRNLPENDLALELGEFFYQLRAALDGLVFEATEVIDSVYAATKENSLEFPIYPILEKFNRCAVNKGPFPDEVKSWLASVQPYSAPSSPDPQIVEHGRRLMILHDCARKDRHRRLHIVAAIPEMSNWDFHPPIPTSHIRYRHANFFENKAEFLEVHAPESDWQNPKINLQGNFTVNISIKETLHKFCVHSLID